MNGAATSAFSLQSRNTGPCGLRSKDAAAIQNLPREKLNSGSSEIRNWICVAGAVEHLSLEWSAYEPGYRTPAGTGTGLGFVFWS